MRYFRPSLLLTLVTIAFVTLTISLGNWQLRRADEKLARLQMLAARAQEPPVDLSQPPLNTSPAWRRVRVIGAFMSGDNLLIDNRIHDHVPGYHVVAPFRVSGTGAVVLVNRGWLAARLDRAAVPPPPAPAGAVWVEGIASVPEQKPFQVGTPRYPVPGSAPALWPNLDLERYRTDTGLAVLPFVVEQTSDSHDGLVRDWPGPPDDVAMHKGYAWQWYTFAALAVGAGPMLAIRSLRSPPCRILRQVPHRRFLSPLPGLGRAARRFMRHGHGWLCCCSLRSPQRP
jgi:cytochrome oxidase assembly protein ShyY1